MAATNSEKKIIDVKNSNTIGPNDDEEILHNPRSKIKDEESKEAKSKIKSSSPENNTTKRLSM